MEEALRHYLASAVIVAALAAGSARADCASYHFGSPGPSGCNQQCQGTAERTDGQCCTECTGSNGCSFAYIGPCPPDGGGGGGGGQQCNHGVCTEGAVQPNAKMPDKLFLVFYQGKAYWFEKPVSTSDDLAVRDAIIRAAIVSQDAGFLVTASSPIYTNNGHLCYITTPSGGRAYYCGQCVGGLGCASVKAISQ